MRDDPQYVAMWLRYSQQVRDMEGVFHYMDSAKIGQNDSHYHITKSVVLESYKRDFHQAYLALVRALELAKPDQRGQVEQMMLLFFGRMQVRYERDVQPLVVNSSKKRSYAEYRASSEHDNSGE